LWIILAKTDAGVIVARKNGIFGICFKRPCLSGIIFDANGRNPTVVSVYPKLSGIWKTFPDIELCQIKLGSLFKSQQFVQEGGVIWPWGSRKIRP
jgi:hypothetical protein